MPVFEVELGDGRVFEVESDQPPTEQDVMTALGGSNDPPPSSPPAAQAQSASGIPETVVGARAAVPAAIRTAGRFAANHPGGIQRVIGAGTTALAGALGGGVGAALGGGPVGGTVGAMTGAMASRGLTPTQRAIREWAGRAKGESRDVAKAAGRAVGIQEYIKNTSGYKVNPADVLERPHGLPAAKSYAQSQGRDLMEIVGPDGKTVVSGPTAVAEPAKKRLGGRLMTKAAKGAGMVGKAISAVTGPIAVTDLAQTIEPNRTDIGVMGIGASQPDPTAEQTQQISTQNRSAMDARLAEQAQQRAAIRDRVMQMLGLR